MMQTERKRMDNYKMLMEFVDRGLICVKIENDTHKNLASCVNSIRQSIKRYHLNHIVVMQRGGEVYLFNKIRIGTLQD
jgi:hypothetical protein